MLLRSLVRRLLEILLVVFGVITVVFVVMHITPGDPTQMMLPDGAPEQAYNQLKLAWDLDKPMYVQYLMFLQKAVRAIWAPRCGAGFRPAGWCWNAFP